MQRTKVRNLYNAFHLAFHANLSNKIKVKEKKEGKNVKKKCPSARYVNS